MTDHYILAASGRPFRDWDAAEMKRQIVATELDDDDFQVVSHPDGGFAVTRDAKAMADDAVNADDNSVPTYTVPEGPGDILARELLESGNNETQHDPAPPIGGLIPPIDADHRPSLDRDSVREPAQSIPAAATDDTQPVHIKGYADGFPPHFVLNVAPRAFLHLHLLTALGTILMLFPHLLFAPLGGFQGFENPELGASVLGIIQLGGLFVGICSLTKFLYTFLFYRYEVTPKYVQAVYGFISRDAPKTYYAHIRSANAVQSGWERLLIVGAVKLGTGATDRHEVVLKHVSDPKRLEKELQRRYEPYITRHAQLD
ncbi:MAG: PH domain-containing protein [Pseudomonadales bacterium]